jgi:hypothetical protein
MLVSGLFSGLVCWLDVCVFGTVDVGGRNGRPPFHWPVRARETMGIGEQWEI